MKTKSSSLLTLLLLVAVNAIAQTGSQYSLDIDRQSLTKALKEFSRQTGLAVGYLPASSTEENTQVGPLKGRYTAENALKEILAKTALRAEFVNPKTVAIRGAKDKDGSAALEPAGQMRMAMAAEGTADEKGTKEAGDDARTVVVNDTKVKPY
jgi:hypothetical protein